jgi:hypothetical protein
MTIVKITGSNNLYRDTESMGLINRDQNGLDDYNMKRKLLLNQKSEINKVKVEMDNLKQDVSEIKQMLLKLMDKE